MDIDESAIKNEVVTLLRKFTNEELEITDNSRIMHDLDLDSVKVMELMMEIEDFFDISVPLNTLPNVQTVTDLVIEIKKLKSQ